MNCEDVVDLANRYYFEHHLLSQFGMPPLVIVREIHSTDGNLVEHDRPKMRITASLNPRAPVLLRHVVEKSSYVGPVHGRLLCSKHLVSTTSR